jgi:pimeloyl-ACP methyl ester carboxylesterase
MTFPHGIFLALLCSVSAIAQEETLVNIGSHKLNLVCIGPTDARPVVILEAGGGGSSATWKDVQAALPKTIRACAYDRAGTGKSDPSPAPHSMEAEITDLHTLLRKSHITEPIVYVGHSLGGILARLFAQRYPASLAAVVLLDPTDENDIVFNTKLNRWMPVCELDGSLGDGARRAAKARQADPATFGDRPLVVIGAGKRTQSPGTSAEQWREMRRSRDERVKGLTQLSRNSKFLLDPISSHNVQHDNPKLVAETIQEVVKQLSPRRTAGRQR